MGDARDALEEPVGELPRTSAEIERVERRGLGGLLGCLGRLAPAADGLGDGLVVDGGLRVLLVGGARARQRGAADGALSFFALDA